MEVRLYSQIFTDQTTRNFFEKKLSFVLIHIHKPLCNDDMCFPVHQQKKKQPSHRVKKKKDFHLTFTKKILHLKIPTRPPPPPPLLRLPLSVVHACG